MTTLKLKNTKMKNSDTLSIIRFFNILTFLPLLTIGTLLVFYLLAALEFGHLPTYANPDPKDSIFSPLMSLIMIEILLSISTIPIWIATATYLRKKLEHKRLIIHVNLYMVFMIGFLIINSFTPIMEWFMD